MVMVKTILPLVHRRRITMVLQIVALFDVKTGKPTTALSAEGLKGFSKERKPDGCARCSCPREPKSKPDRHVRTKGKRLVMAW